MKFALASAAALAMLAASPASAAKMLTCSGDGPSKLTAMMATMPYIPPKSDMMNMEVAKANMAMSKGDMRGCNRAMMRAQRMNMARGGMM